MTPVPPPPQAGADRPASLRSRSAARPLGFPPPPLARWWRDQATALPTLVADLAAATPDAPRIVWRAAGSPVYSPWRHRLQLARATAGPPWTACWDALHAWMRSRQPRDLLQRMELALYAGALALFGLVRTWPAPAWILAWAVAIVGHVGITVRRAWAIDAAAAAWWQAHAPGAPATAAWWDVHAVRRRRALLAESILVATV